MDLSKAFDTVDKAILQQKLNNLGLSKDSILLLSSYMSDRKFVMTNDSESFELSYGVPQGSILGPLLFIMYTSDMTEITKNNKVIVYADDTTVLVTGRNLLKAKQHCNDILTRFYNYFTVNKLSINPTKTKYMIYKPDIHNKNAHKKLTDNTNTKLVMNDSPLESVDNIKFLGLIINNKLTWEPHKKYIYNKVCKNIGLIKKCKQVMDEKSLINMYKAFIQPYFMYAIEAWGHTTKSSNDTLIKLQSKILRIIYSFKRSEDAWRYNNSYIKTIPRLYYESIIKMCLKHHSCLLPSYVADHIMPKLNITVLQKRISKTTLPTMYDYQNHKKNLNSSLQNNCIKTWNSEPLSLKSIPYCFGIKETYHALQKFEKSHNY